MKALSVRQPWASLIALGEKTLECRSWTTRYRGPLLICASQRGDWVSALASKKLRDAPTPLGVALCIVDLVDVRPARPGDERAACCHVHDGFVWEFREPRCVEPVPVKGKLGLWVPDFEDARGEASEARGRARGGRAHGSL
jgi:hypothetical protein